MYLDNVYLHIFVSMERVKVSYGPSVSAVGKPCLSVICWPSPSNYRQIAYYQRGVGDHRVGQ